MAHDSSAVFTPLHGFQDPCHFRGRDSLLDQFRRGLHLVVPERPTEPGHQRRGGVDGRGGGEGKGIGFSGAFDGAERLAFARGRGRMGGEGRDWHRGWCSECRGWGYGSDGGCKGEPIRRRWPR